MSSLRAKRVPRGAVALDRLALKIESAKLSYGIGVSPPDEHGLCAYDENLHIEAECVVERRRL